jgi:hypothetical protein
VTFIDWNLHEIVVSSQLWTTIHQKLVGESQLKTCSLQNASHFLSVYRPKLLIFFFFTKIIIVFFFLYSNLIVNSRLNRDAVPSGAFKSPKALHPKGFHRANHGLRNSSRKHLFPFPWEKIFFIQRNSKRHKAQTSSVE